MRPQGRGSRLAAALVLAMTLGGVTAQVAIADDDTDVPTRKQVREANQAVDEQTLDVEGIQQALNAANDRLEAASIAAAQAAEEFNGARWEAKQARGESRRAAAVALEAAEDAERQRDAYQDTLVTSYTHGTSLGALSSVVESDGLSELVQRSATMRNSESAMDAKYDDFVAAQSKADDAAEVAEDALDEAEDAEESARDARDAAQVAADDAAVAAQDIAAEKTDLIARLAELKGISIELAERRQSGLEARAAEEAAERAARDAQREADPEPPADPEPTESPTEPEPQEPPADPDPTPPPSPGGGAHAAIAFARAQLGEPYHWGAAGPGSWDCSGLTMGAWSAGGKSLPHYSVAQYQQSTAITAAQLQPGDLVFWGSSSSSSSIYHVALYVGDGRIIHAPRTGRPVSEESMYYWITPNFYAR
ncbi:MAG TPA: C40 family peptidase, partial [Nocardioides sp.]|nr:C40 family peptidase [Nocardioides sp.]